MTGRPNAQHRRRPAVFWLIAKQGAEQDEVLTINLDGKKEAAETLPVFCFEDEARMFLSLGGLRSGWQTKEITVDNLTGMLLGPCAGVRFVSLDPLPELVYRGMMSLVSLRKEQFVDRFSDAVIENNENMKPLAR